MIATILPNSPNFHAVEYNEHKVQKGVATLLEIRNFGGLESLPNFSASEMVGYLNTYTSRNDRIKKAQFHVAISCRGKESTTEELLEFAHQYLKEMGYGDPEQPLLIYLHNDTDNRHLHIITSRIRPDGKKIDHNHERRRSQEVVSKLMGNNLTNDVEKAYEEAKQYSFQTIGQFTAILTSMGLESFKDSDGEHISVKKGGSVRMKIYIPVIQQLLDNDRKEDKKRKAQLRTILRKYRDMCDNKEMLVKELKKKFGLDLVFVGRKDQPGGYIIVDHKNKVCYNGSSILRMGELLRFQTKHERLNNINEFVNKLLASHPDYITHDVNKRIAKYRAYIKKGIIYFMNDDASIILNPICNAILKRNDKLNYIRQFNPSSLEELMMFGKIYNVPGIEKSVNLISYNSDKNIDFKHKVKGIFQSHSQGDLRRVLRGEGIIIKRDGERYFAIDFTNKCIMNLSKEGIDVSRLHANRHSSHNNTHNRNHGSRIHNTESYGKNREWEVGNNHADDAEDEYSSGRKY